MLADPAAGANTLADEKDAATEINTDDVINTPKSSEDILHVERLSTPTSSSEDNPERQEML